MKKIVERNSKGLFIIALFLVAVFFLLPLNGVKAETGKISDFFPDKGLAQVVASQLGKKVDDPVTNEELGTIFIVDGSKKEIKDLRGISKLTKLEQLKLSDNQLSSLSPELKELKNLNSLDVSGNRIDIVPVWLGDLPLKELSLANNKVKNLPSGLNKGNSLLVLDVSDNELINLPSDMEKWTELTRLDLSGNKVLMLPNIFGSMTKLVSLDFSGNRLFSLPVGMTAAVALESIDISGNSFELFPKEIMGLPHLKAVRISNNQLTNLPDEMSLPMLEILDLSGNHLKSLPDSLQRIESLVSLDVSKMQLTSTPEWLATMTNLKKLSLNNNSLSEAFPVVPPLEEYDNRGQIGSVQIISLKYEEDFEAASFVTPILLELQALNGNSLKGQGYWKVVLPDETSTTLKGEEVDKIVEMMKTEPGKYTLMFFVDNKNKQQLDGSTYTMEVTIASINCNVKGQVTDNDSRGVEGALVNALDDKGEIIRQTTTDRRGYYSFYWGLPEGGYIIQVEKNQFPKKEQPVILGQGEFLMVNVILGKEEGTDTKVPSTGGGRMGTIVLGAGILTIGGFIWSKKRNDQRVK